MKNFIDKYSEIIINSAIKVFLAIVILVVGFKLVKFLIGRLAKSRGFKKIDPNAQSFIKSALSICAKIIVIITAAAVVGIPVTSFSALIASAGLAVGLALQGGLSNIAGGVLLLIFKPFSIGDYIKTEQGFEGTVIKVDIFYTTLRMNDNTKVVVPNGKISNETISDVSSYGTRRVDFTFSASYACDAEAVTKLLIKTAQSHELVLKDPSPFAALKTHGDSSLDFVLQVWCNKDDYWKVYFDIPTAVKKIFDENGIEIPFPQVDVHIKEQRGAD